MPRQSILIIGGTGGTGHEVMRQFLSHPSRPDVHLFCRNPSKISSDDKEACKSIQQGDALNSDDLASALTKTKPTHVVVSIGKGTDVSKTDIRTASAQALVHALETTSGLQNVQVVVVSSTGAGPSQIKVGMGIGKLIEYHLRHVLNDHTGQEAAFLENSSGMANRTWIVRATALKDDQPTGQVVTFGDKDKSPTVHIDRADVAMYIVKGISEKDDVGGRVDNITTPKTVKQ